MSLPRPVLVVLGLYPLLVMAWLTAWDRDVLYLATYDDLYRIQHAWEAANGALFPTELWPPLPFWLTAIPFRLWPDGHVVPQLCGLLVSTLALGCLAGVGIELGLTAAGAATAVLFAGLLPWSLYLAPSALAEPYAHLFLLYAAWSLLRTLRGEARMAHVVAGIVLAGMCRYEAWAAGALFSVWAWRRGERGAAVAPWVFPACWVALQLAWTGNPLFFGSEAVTASRSDFGTFGWITRLPGALVAVFGPLVALAVAGWRELGDRRGATLLARASALYVAAIVVAWFSGLIGVHNTARHLLLPGMLFALPCAALVDRIRANVGSLAAGGVVFATLQVLALADDGPPDGVDDHISVLGRRLRSMRAAREIPEGGTILIESAPMDCFGLRIASGTMTDSLFDRDVARVPTDRAATKIEDAANPSVLDLPRPRLEAWLREHNVGAILTRDRDRQNMAASFGRQVDFQGGWSLVRVER